MSWELRENDDGSWDWEACQSAYGLAMGTEPTLAEACVRLALGEARMVEDPIPPLLESWMLDHCEEHLVLMADGLLEAVDRHIFPLDVESFRASLRHIHPEGV